MGFFRRGSNANYNLLDRHAYFVPGIGGTFALLGWFGLGVAISVTVGAIIGIITQIMGNGVTLADLNSANGFGLEYMQLIVYPIMFIPVYLWVSHKSAAAMYTREGYALDSNNFGRYNFWVAAAICTVGAIGMAFIMDGLSSLILPDMSDAIDKAMKDLIEGDFIACFISVSVMAPLLEEWFVRGLILRGLLNAKRRSGRRVMNPWLAITVSAAIFALIHMNIWQALPAFTLGFVFGIVYYKTGSLKLTILMHFVNNTLALIVARIDALKDITAWWDVLNPTTYLVLLGVAVLIVAGLVVFFLRLPAKGCDAIPPAGLEETPLL